MLFNVFGPSRVRGDVCVLPSGMGVLGGLEILTPMFALADPSYYHSYILEPSVVWPSSWPPPTLHTLQLDEIMVWTSQTSAELYTIRHPVLTSSKWTLIESQGKPSSCAVTGVLENPIFGMSFVCVFSHGRVFFYVCWPREDTAGKGFPMGVVCDIPSIQSLFLSALGGVRIAERFGKRRLARVISFHLNFSLSLAKQTPTHMHTVHTCILYIHAFIFTENASPSRWQPHGCCHALELESRRGGEMGRVIQRQSKRGSASKRGRGEREWGQCQQLGSQHSQLKSTAPLRSSERRSRQNAAGSVGKHRQTRQRHGIRPQNTNSKGQKKGFKSRGWRNALKISRSLASLTGSLYLKWRDTGTIHFSGQPVWLW